MFLDREIILILGWMITLLTAATSKSTSKRSGATMNSTKNIRRGVSSCSSCTDVSCSQLTSTSYSYNYGVVKGGQAQKKGEENCYDVCCVNSKSEPKSSKSSKSSTSSKSSSKSKSSKMQGYYINMTHSGNKVISKATDYSTSTTTSRASHSRGGSQGDELSTELSYVLLSAIAGAIVLGIGIGLKRHKVVVEANNSTLLDNGSRPSTSTRAARVQTLTASTPLTEESSGIAPSATVALSSVCSDSPDTDLDTVSQCSSSVAEWPSFSDFPYADFDTYPISEWPIINNVIKVPSLENSTRTTSEIDERTSFHLSR